MEIATLTTINGMDSRDIAELTGKDHAHVCRDVRTMCAEIGLDESKFGSVYLAGNGEKRTCYIIPKRECLILASGYNIKLRAAVVDRWIELESSSYIPKTLSQALRLAADQAETIEKQTLLIEAQKPAVEFVERFVEAKQTQPLRAVAKVLGIKEKAFVSALLENGILYRLGGKLTPKAEYVNKYFEVKEVVAGNGYATTQMRFTTEGVEWISRKVQVWGIDA